MSERRATLIPSYGESETREIIDGGVVWVLQGCGFVSAGGTSGVGPIDRTAVRAVASDGRTASFEVGFQQKASDWALLTAIHDALR